MAVSCGVEGKVSLPALAIVGTVVCMVRVVDAEQLGRELGTILKDVARGNEIVLTQRGRRRAVLIDHRRLQALQEIAGLAQDPEAQGAMSRSDADVRAGRVYGLKGRPTIPRILALRSSRSRPKRVA
jgi:prevent-host-death family protein